MKSKFLKPEKNTLLNPIDYYNFFGSFVAIFDDIKVKSIKNEYEVCLLSPKTIETNDINKTTFLLKNGIVETLKENQYDIAVGSKISKFMLLTAIKFKCDTSAAMSFVSYNLMKSEIPYIRVGTDYFKIIQKINRYNAKTTLLKSWKKDEIKEDHTKGILNHVFKFDDFTIMPNNKVFIPVQNNCYNLYAKFPHEEYDEDVTLAQIPTTYELMSHIFGDQIQLGFKYMKLLYENPMQILPIISLVSTERETGKTTFLNWITMIFGENSTIINPSDLTSDFNDAYATKNIIMIDETVIDKANTIEKLKSLATAKTISVNKKFVANYSVPFFGKIIICTNKETDFIRIDEEEIRFWVRKIKPITRKKNTNIEQHLFDEIPLFLKYLTLLPEVDLSMSRMVFTNEEIKTDSLDLIKNESKSSLRKELEILIDDYFNNRSDINDFEATAKDIKEKWFAFNNNFSSHYIFKVLKDEMKSEFSSKLKKYYPFKEQNLNQKAGTPFKFYRENNDFLTEKVEEDNPF